MRVAWDKDVEIGRQASPTFRITLFSCRPNELCLVIELEVSSDQMELIMNGINLLKLKRCCLRVHDDITQNKGSGGWWLFPFGVNLELSTKSQPSGVRV